MPRFCRTVNQSFSISGINEKWPDFLNCKNSLSSQKRPTGREIDGLIIEAMANNKALLSQFLVKIKFKAIKERPKLRSRLTK